MENKLQLIKTDVFDGVEYSIYSDSEEMYMTINQIAECLGYTNRKGIEKLIERNEYLKETEFSVTVKMSATDGKRYNTRIFTEDGIYEITMLAKTEVAKEFRSRVRKVLKEIRKGTIQSISSNSCAVAFAKDRISKWKRGVSNPLVDRLHMLLSPSATLIDTYAYIYKKMKTEYDFDMNEEKFKFSQKYNLPLAECSVIDTIADNKQLRFAFVCCANESIKNGVQIKLESVKQFAERCNKVMKDVGEYSLQFENEIISALDTADCNCLDNTLI